MKNFVCFLIIVFSTEILLSQTNLIPNPSFENWSSGEPVNWETNNDTLRGRIMVTQSDLAYHGSSAIQLETIDFNGLAGGAFVNSDTFSVGALENRPVELSGYYRFAPVGDAICVANVIVFNYFGSFLVTCGFGIDTLVATEEYTRFAIPIFYGSQFDTAVSVSINLKVHSQRAYEQSIGALALIDSVSLSATITDIQAQDLTIPRAFNLEQNYPNPFNPTTMINYQLSTTNFVELGIYNLIGQKVATLVSEVQSAGQHQVQWDASGFANGIYYYRINAGGWTDVKKMVLLK